jgi:hypothetical protein
MGKNSSHLQWDKTLTEFSMWYIYIRTVNTDSHLGLHEQSEGLQHADRDMFVQKQATYKITIILQAEPNEEFARP